MRRNGEYSTLTTVNTTIIISTTGASCLKEAVQSVLSQSTDCGCYVVCDGLQYEKETRIVLTELGAIDDPRFKLCVLPENVGADGFYGHRIYAAFTHLVNTKYVGYLDQDNRLCRDHVTSCETAIEEFKWHWCYSLRNIYDTDGMFVCKDDCESLGSWPGVQSQNMVDTNCYFLRTDIAKRICPAWHGKWGQDRIFYAYAAHNTLNLQFGCTGKYTVDYCLGGNTGSVVKEFFLAGNKQQELNYPSGFPWRK